MPVAAVHRGEIFARRDFLDIYTYAKRKGFLITLFTNGTLITPRIADYLAVWRPFAIEITLYGRTRATYERLTGVPGSYDKCLRGIDLLLERGLPLALKSVAVTVNVHELRDMQQFAEDLGVGFKFDGMMNPRVDCSQSPLAVRLSPEDCVALDIEDPRRMDAWKEFAKDNLGPANPPERADEVYHCGGGITAFAIDPQGGLSICVLSQQDKFDLRRGSLRDGWDGALLAVRRRKITAPTKCTMCELKSMCGMCPAMGELENGDPEAPVDFLCRVAHMRAYAFDLPVVPHGSCEYLRRRRRVRRNDGFGRQAQTDRAGRAPVRRASPATDARGTLGERMWQRRWMLLMQDPRLMTEDRTDGSRTGPHKTTVRQAGDQAGRAQAGRSRARRLQGDRRLRTWQRRRLPAPDSLQLSRVVAECISGSAGSRSRSAHANRV